MIKSMTGFGRAKFEQNGREYTVEIKSVNHKYSDISIKMPRTISYLEEKVKKEISKAISRGKVDVSITLENNSEIGKSVRLNTELAKEYVKELRRLCDEARLEENISATEIVKLPEVLKLQSNEEDETIEKELIQTVTLATNNFVDMRQKEGVSIAEDLKKRIKKIDEQISKISEYSTGLVEEYVVKLEERIKELLKTDIIDEARLAQEVVIYSDKCSVEEELTRLKSYVKQFLELLETDEPCGKKLDFIIQEMNRETNTIGSKSGSLDITNLVIEIKTEIENVREQIQNIE